MSDLIKQIADEVFAEKGKNDWVEVSLRLGKRHGIVKSADTCRKAVARIKDKPLDEKTLERLEINGNGTIMSERILSMSDEEMKDPEKVMIAHGYDPKQFLLEKITSSLYRVQSKDKDLNNYQSKIVIKPKELEDLTQCDIVSLAKEIKPLPQIKLKPAQDGEKFALEIDLADIHIGSLSWHEETGYDNDYKIAFGNLYKIIEQAKNIIMNYPVEKLYLCFLGDFLHIDTESMTTTKGTKVDFDSRPKKMVIKGYEMIINIIDNLAIVPTEVIWIEGNHSRNLEFSVFYAMPFIYAKNPHIKFDVSPKLRKAFTYGDVLVGLHHGEINKTNKYNWLQVEFRQEWGLAKFTETHSGHIHHESVTNRGGITERSNPSPKIIDKYEYEEGYVGTERSVMAYLWNKTTGLRQIHYLK